MNRKICLIITTILSVLSIGLSARAATTNEERYVFSNNELSISKKVGTLKFEREYVYSQNDRSNLGASFVDEEKELRITFFVYPCPPNTKGYTLCLNDEGERIITEDGFKKHLPSQSYENEYQRMLNNIKRNGCPHLMYENYITAVPDRNDTPLFKAVKLRTDTLQQSKHFKEPYIGRWDAYLTCIGDYFIKIYFTYPEVFEGRESIENQLNLMELQMVPMKLIESANWEKILPPAPPKSKKQKKDTEPPNYDWDKLISEALQKREKERKATSAP